MTIVRITGAGKTGIYVLYVNNLLNCDIICVNTQVNLYSKQRLMFIAILHFR